MYERCSECGDLETVRTDSNTNHNEGRLQQGKKDPTTAYRARGRILSVYPETALVPPKGKRHPTPLSNYHPSFNYTPRSPIHMGQIKHNDGNISRCRKDALGAKGRDSVATLHHWAFPPHYTPHQTTRLLKGRLKVIIKGGETTVERFFCGEYQLSMRSKK